MFDFLNLNLRDFCELITIFTDNIVFSLKFGLFPIFEF